MGLPDVDYLIKVFGYISSSTSWEYEAGKWGLRDDGYGHLVPYTLVDGIATAGVSFDDASFLADSVAFDHDVPTYVSPSDGHIAAPGKPVGMNRPWVDRDQQYEEALEVFFSTLVDLRFTDGIRLRYAEHGDPLTRFEERFPGVRRQLLALYAMAMRQVDTLGTYLCLYRVLECADGKNGKQFIEKNLVQIHAYDFGTLMTKGLTAPGGPTAVDYDVFESYRDQAVQRVADLRAEGKSDKQLASHLYGFRNGLAHGRPGAATIVLQDFGAQTEAVASDLPLLKLLARIAVETC